MPNEEKKSDGPNLDRRYVVTSGTLQQVQDQAERYMLLGYKPSGGLFRDTDGTYRVVLYR